MNPSLTQQDVLKRMVAEIETMIRDESHVSALLSERRTRLEPLLPG